MRLNIFRGKDNRQKQPGGEYLHTKPVREKGPGAVSIIPEHGNKIMGEIYSKLKGNNTPGMADKLTNLQIRWGLALERGFLTKEEQTGFNRDLKAVGIHMVV